MVLERLLSVTALLMLLGAQEPNAADSAVEVEVKQKYLVPLCLDGAPLEPGERSWKLASGAHSIASTMRNDPRSGSPVPDADPGVALVRFKLEPGHRYDVEARAPSASFSSRVWSEGEWKPVVRDRTIDRIVSGDPEWKPRGAPCTVE